MYVYLKFYFRFFKFVYLDHGILLLTTMDKRLMNVSILGLGFMFVFTSFQTVSNVEVSYLNIIVLIYSQYDLDIY